MRVFITSCRARRAWKALVPRASGVAIEVSHGASAAYLEWQLPAGTIRGSLLTNLADELQAAYDHILEQFALELLIDAHDNSDWSNGCPR